MGGIETETLRLLAEAIENLQDAGDETNCGLTDDHIRAAIVEAAHAIRQLVWLPAMSDGMGEFDRDYGDEQP